jgi:hypothetical protein
MCRRRRTVYSGRPFRGVRAQHATAGDAAARAGTGSRISRGTLRGNQYRQVRPRRRDRLASEAPWDRDLRHKQTDRVVVADQVGLPGDDGEGADSGARRSARSLTSTPIWKPLPIASSFPAKRAKPRVGTVMDSCGERAPTGKARTSSTITGSRPARRSWCSTASPRIRSSRTEWLLSGWSLTRAPALSTT